jgi:hypothetical protein
MAKLEKHKRNLIQEWLGAEEETVPAHPRGIDAQEMRVKIRKPLVAGRLRLARPSPPAPRPEPALVREPARPPKTVERGSQASSREHLLKLERLPQLRAAYSRSGRPARGPMRRPAAVASRVAGRRARGGKRVR